MAALSLWVAWVLVRPRGFDPLAQPAPRAGFVYGASVVGMLVVIWVGARLLAATDRAELVPAVVASAVGLHFLPFARAFRAPVFWSLGAVLALLGAAGLVLGLAGLTAAAPGAGVLAGIARIAMVAMVAMVAVDARR